MTTHLSRTRYEVISEPLAGERFIGDNFFVKECDDFILLSVIDGLGHGENAALATQKAIEILNNNSAEPIETLIKLCDNALKNTRGAAMTLAKIDSNNTLHYFGIGNVAGICWKRNNYARLMTESLILECGIVGYQLPQKIEVRTINLSAGDIVIFATDGIKNLLEIQASMLETIEKTSKRIFCNNRNKNDDGLVLVMQLLS